MFFRKHKPIDEAEFSDVIERLRAERPEPTPLELDEIKTRAIRQANRRGPTTTGASMRRTLIVALATGSLMLTGTGAVIAGDKGDKKKGTEDGPDNNNGQGQEKNASKKQYSHCKKSGKSSSSNKSGNQQDCPTPPPSGGSHGNGSHQSHKGGKSHGSH